MSNDATAPRFAALIATGARLTATRSRSAKVAALAELVRAVPAAERPIVIGLLVGQPRQGRIGIGWAHAFNTTATPAAVSTLTIRDVDDALTDLAALEGAGSAGARQRLLDELFARCTADEVDYLRRVFVGELRHGALAGLVADAIARADEVEPSLVRRAAMLLGDLGEAATVSGRGGAGALADVGLTVGRPIQPMLASPASGLAEALDGMQAFAVEWKLDGIRIQLHKHGDDVHVFTRNLHDITSRVPEVVAIAREMPALTLVLDGEAMGLSSVDESLDPAQHATPAAFQDTMSSVAGRDASTSKLTVRPFFFDCLHHDGEDLLDRPFRERHSTLSLVVGAHRVTSVHATDHRVVASVAEDAVAAGHEGVVIKDLDAPYEAGRRGRAWRKVKPVHTYDLVVLAVEWGHGRRLGLLSNLHLGARDPSGGFVMVGRTFKGLTDSVLSWQTERFLALETRRTSSTVYVRPEQVVEVAIDGVQSSRRYPGGVALRFARVKRYRTDKTAAEADTIATLQALLPREPG